MTIEDDVANDAGPKFLRPARMRIETTVLMSHGVQSHPTELVDISATGALLRRPLGWQGELGQNWVLDMIFGRDLHIHLVRHGKAAIDGGGCRAPILMQLQPDDARLHLLAQGSGQ